MYSGSQEQFIAGAASVLKAARKAGMPVIHIQVGFRPGLPEIGGRNKLFGAIKSSPQHQEFFRGPSGAIHPALGPEPDDIVITKHRVSAFTGTDLDMILRAKEIEKLVMFGIATSGVVLSTLLDASDADYEVAVISDCCADRDAELHNALMGRLFPARGEVMTAENSSARSVRCDGGRGLRLRGVVLQDLIHNQSTGCSRRRADDHSLFGMRHFAQSHADACSDSCEFGGTLQRPRVARRINRFGAESFLEIHAFDQVMDGRSGAHHLVDKLGGFILCRRLGGGGALGGDRLHDRKRAECKEDSSELLHACRDADDARFVARGGVKICEGRKCLSPCYFDFHCLPGLATAYISALMRSNNFSLSWPS